MITSRAGHRAQDRVASGDLGHHTRGRCVKRHHVANADRTVEQDDEATDVVAGNLLQTEAEADAERTAEN
jgi:hypothetical protein